MELQNQIRKESLVENKPRGIQLFEGYIGGVYDKTYAYDIRKLDDENVLFSCQPIPYGYLKSTAGRWEIEKTFDEYLMFQKEMKEVICDWEENYHNPNILDGTQWHIQFEEEHKKYAGSNAYPENFDDMKQILKKYFKKDEEPDIFEKLKDNPFLEEMFQKEEEEREKKKREAETSNGLIKVNIKNQKDNYLLMFQKNGTKNSDLIFANLNQLNGGVPIGLSVYFEVGQFNQFYQKLIEITKNWKTTYMNGKDSVNWKINLEIDNNKDIMIGQGEYPENWNQLIDLLVSYEMLYKQRKKEERSH